MQYFYLITFAVLIHSRNTNVATSMIMMSSSPSSSSATKKLKTTAPNKNDNQKEYYYVGLDVGTQGTKAVAIHHGKVISRASVSYGLAPNPHNIKGRAEQDPQTWLNAVDTCLTKIINECDHNKTNDNNNKLTLGGIGVSGQQHGMVALSEAYEPIRLAKLWCDVEADEEAKEFSKQATEILKKPWNIPAGFTCPKILWMKKKERSLFDQTKWFCLPHDYITLKLISPPMGTQPTTDAGDASGSGLWDATEQQYVSQLVQIIDDDLHAKLPKVLPPNAIAGYLSKEYCTKLFSGDEGSQDTFRIPISVGSGDNMCSAMGVGCVTPGNAVMSLGTSGTIFGVSSTPVIQDGISGVAPFQDATGKHLPLVCTMSCTGVLEYVLNVWCSGSGSHDSSLSSSPNKVSHAEATEEAKRISPGCEGVTFLPFIGGERTPNWPHATGCLLGLTSTNMTPHNRVGLLYRAAMEGVTFVLADAMIQLQKACSSTSSKDDCDDDEITTSTSTWKTLYLVGGGSKNLLWRQMIADVLGVELKFPKESESAALGAAFQVAAVASSSAISTDSDGTAVAVDEYIRNQPIDLEDVTVRPTKDKDVLQGYQKAFKRYQRLSKKLFADTDP